MLSKKHVSDICNMHGGQSECRYLEMRSDGRFYCLKLRPIKKQIDDVIKEYIKLGNTDYAIGDNCAGYPLLNNIEQGYDQP